MLLRSSWGKDLNRYLYFSYRNVFWGIRQGIYNLGIDFDIDKKENFAPSDLNKDANPEPTDFNLDSNIQADPVYFELDGNVQKESVKAELDKDANAEPVYFELDRNILEESVKVELDKDAKIESVDLELDVNIQAGQVNYEIDGVTKIEPIDFELNSDVKAKLVDLLPESQILPTGIDSNITVESSPQISVANINVLATSFKGQSETDTQFSKSSLIPFVDFPVQDFSAKRLFTSLSDLIDDNNASFQSFFPSLAGFDSLIKNISISSNFPFSKKQSLENLDGAFDNPDHLFEWSSLALDNATLSTSGPTAVTRLFALLTTSMWDVWAVFEDKAVGSIYNQDKQDNFIALLESFDISCSDLAKFKRLYQCSANNVKEILEHAVRQVAMDVSAFNVLSEIQSSLFIGGIPDVLVGTAEELLSKSLANTAELLSVDNIADLVISIGTEIGENVSSSINQYAKKDGSNQSGFYADTTGYSPSQSVYDPDDPDTKIDSKWQPLPGQDGVTPQWGSVTPFAINPHELIPSTILTPYTETGELSEEFISELTFVRDKRLILTPLEKAIAEYYEGGPETAFPPGLWFEQAIKQALSLGLDLDESLKLTFGVALAMFDAGIATWKLKYLADSVRPTTVIQQYMPEQVLSDGSLAKDWESYLPVPAFQDIASGHSSFSASANFIFIESFNSNVFDFSVTLEDDDSQYSENGFDGMPGIGSDIIIEATYFTEAADQGGESRIFGGIHMPEGDLKGRIIGTQSASLVLQKINSLEQGISVEEVGPLPSLEFGTMGNDILTGLTSEAFDEKSVQQLYAFNGDDTLIAEGNSLWHLYGGSGQDTFKIYETGSVIVRDYESMEEIELAPALFEAGGTIGDIQFNISATEPFTYVSLDERLLFTMDGSWGLDDVNISILV